MFLTPILNKKEKNVGQQPQDSRVEKCGCEWLVMVNFVDLAKKLKLAINLRDTKVCRGSIKTLAKCPISVMFTLREAHRQPSSTSCHWHIFSVFAPIQLTPS